ncbi:hypothetical protein KCU62_g7042, partial [Aureobasidium sp. EXF-3399]
MHNVSKTQSDIHEKTVFQTAFCKHNSESKTVMHLNHLYTRHPSGKRYRETHVRNTSDQLRMQNKTYSSRDSHVVTHRSTNLPFNCLCMAERTGCPVFS